MIEHVLTQIEDLNKKIEELNKQVSSGASVLEMLHALSTIETLSRAAGKAPAADFAQARREVKLIRAARQWLQALARNASCHDQLLSLA